MKSSQPASVSSSSASKSNRICRTERKEEISIQSSAQSPSSYPSDPLTAPSKKGKKAVEGKKIAKETTVTVKDSCSGSVSIAAVQTFEVSTVQKASSGTPSIRDRRAKPFGNSAAVLQTGCSEVRHLERVSSNGPFGSSCNDLAEVVHEKNKSTAKGKKAKAVIEDLGMTAELVLAMDSSAGLAVAARQGVGRLRHVEVKYLWLQSQIEAKKFRLEKIL
jgi:hypothetical protein